MIVEALLDLAVVAGFAAVGYAVFRGDSRLAHDVRELNHRVGIQHPYGLVGLAIMVLGTWLIGLPLSESSSDVIVGTASAGVILGAFLVAVGLSNLPRKRMLDRADEVGCGDATSGLVAVEGEVQPAGETLSTPFTEREAVYYETVVKERGGLKNHLRTTDRWRDGTRFAVEDETGSVIVDPDEAWIIAEPGSSDDRRPYATGFEYTVIEDGGEVTGNAREILDERDGPSSTRDGEVGTDTYLGETCIQPGDTVSVIGRASGGTGPDGYAVTVIEDGKGFTVLPESLETARGRFRSRGRLALLAGIGALLFSVAVGAFVLL